MDKPGKSGIEPAVEKGGAANEGVHSDVDSSVEMEETAVDIPTLQNELSQLTDRLQRQAAEFQNYRRRTEQEKSQMVVFGKSMVIQQLLDVFDDFHRSIEAAKDASDGSDSASPQESLKSGVELAYQKLMDELKKMGVEPIQALGQPFDEELHEAVLQQPAGENEEVGIVLSEIQRGFRMGDRVLRHSKVIVSVENPEANG